MSQYAKIAGTGHYLPERIMTNAEVSEFCDTSDEWIQSRSGIKQRHVCADGETTSDMAAEAGRRALEAAGWDAKDLDLIIVGTCSAEFSSPSCATQVQTRLGAPTCPAFDIGAACAGFVYGLDVVDRFIRTDGAKRVLLVGTEQLSPTLDWNNRGTAVLFGDGAGAVAIEPADEPGLVCAKTHADGNLTDILVWTGNLTRDTDPHAINRVHMKGNDVFKHAVKAFSNVIDEALAAANLTKRDIDWVIPHQANIRIINAVAKKLSMPMERVVVTVDSHANTSSASVPMAFDVAVRDGRIKRGDNVLMAAFGAGLVWGAAVVRY